MNIREAITALREVADALENFLGDGAPASNGRKAKGKKGKRTVSKAARQRMSDAANARWAKVRAQKKKAEAK